MFTRRVLNAFARLEPFDRQLEIRIRETGSGFSRARALVVLVVGLPGDVDHARNLSLDPLELGIVEPFAQTTLELLAGQLDITLSLAHVNRHVPSRRRTLAICLPIRYMTVDEPARRARMIRSNP